MPFVTRPTSYIETERALQAFAGALAIGRVDASELLLLVGHALSRDIELPPIVRGALRTLPPATALDAVRACAPADAAVVRKALLRAFAPDGLGGELAVALEELEGKRGASTNHRIEDADEARPDESAVETPETWVEAASTDHVVTTLLLDGANDEALNTIRSVPRLKSDLQACSVAAERLSVPLSPRGQAVALDASVARKTPSRHAVTIRAARPSTGTRVGVLALAAAIVLGVVSVRAWRTHQREQAEQQARKDDELRAKQAELDALLHQLREQRKAMASAEAALGDPLEDPKAPPHEEKERVPQEDQRRTSSALDVGGTSKRKVPPSPPDGGR